MRYHDNGVNLPEIIDLNDVVNVDNSVSYPFLKIFGEAYFNIRFVDGVEMKVCLLTPKNKIEYLFFWKRIKMIEKSHSWLLEAWNEVQREKKEQPDWYLSG